MGAPLPHFRAASLSLPKTRQEPDPRDTFALLAFMKNVPQLSLILWEPTRASWWRSSRTGRRSTDRKESGREGAGVPLGRRMRRKAERKVRGAGGVGAIERLGGREGEGEKGSSPRAVLLTGPTRRLPPPPHPPRTSGSQTQGPLRAGQSPTRPVLTHWILSCSLSQPGSPGVLAIP